MRVAIIGSRGLLVENLKEWIPDGCHEIVSGGAKGVDACAALYAKENGLPLVEFLPEYEKYRRGAPIVRNQKIVEYADRVVAFWDGQSKGTLSVIRYCERIGKPCRVVMIEKRK